MSRVPAQLRTSIAALVLLIGAGGGAYYVDEAATREANSNAYIQAVAADPEVSDAIRIAMVMASFYESSNRHIGTPYVDKLGKGQPLTVCNGLTGAGVVAGRYYSPAECYRLEKRRYVGYEVEAARLLTHWKTYDPFQQATFLDFLHNKGEGSFFTSTMRRKANAGDWLGACRENTRWNRGTVKGVSTVLPGLQLRGDSNDEICRTWRLGAHP
ncbi:MAG: glycoside hydrolase family protein [Acidovorax sp.]|uniref:glycoside hydrolase family protein n=1 Tax=Acidovorax sp. TaxID=1872122 RepID=UPI003919A9C6